MAKDKGPVDISEARKHRAEIMRQYSEPSDGMIDSFEADWRAAWAEACKKTGKTIPFEEWFFATDENGDCPFEIAGAWFLSEAKK